MKLNKIKLINWHLFRNSTIEVKGNFLITGENGCGKSTLTDALYYVLSGGDESCFNSAANVDAKRSLSTYIRGRVGNEGEGKEYLRNEKDLLAHIALEFVEEGQGTLVLGTVIEMVDFGKPKARFYYMKDHPFVDEDFLDGKKIRDFKSLEKHCSDKGIAFQKMEDVLYRRKKSIASDVFHLENGARYADLLKKSMAFRPISEVSSFVNDFLLKENNIEITTLVDEIRQYREIKNELDKEQNRLSCLEAFLPQAEAYERNARHISYFRALESLSKIKANTASALKMSEEIARIDDNMTELRNSISKQSERLDYLNGQKRLLESSEAFSAVADKKKRLASLEEEKVDLQERIEASEAMIEEERALLRAFAIKADFSSELAKRDFASFKAKSRASSAALEDLEERFRSTYAAKNNDITAKKEELSRERAELLSLDRGQNTYRPEVSKLLHAVREGLQQKYGHPIEVRPLCEYLDVADKEWANAVEGYLNTQRFDLIVDPAYFDDASQIYEDIKNREHIYGVGIVYCEEGPVETSPNTLYTKIRVDNPYADYAASLILGKVYCAEDVLDLKSHPVSITKTGMTYRNRTVRNINPEVYRFPYLGRESFDERKRLLSRALEEGEAALQAMGEDAEKIRQAIARISSSKMKEILALEDLHGQLGAVNNEIEEINASLQAQDSEQLLALQGEINRVSGSIGALQTQIKAKREQEMELSSSRGAKEALRKKAVEETEELRADYDKARATFDEEDYSSFIAAYEIDGEVSGKKVSEEMMNAYAANSSLRPTIERGMREYASKYALALAPIIDNVGDFISEFYKLKNRDLLAYKDKADAAFLHCKEGFEADFVSKLHGRIDEAKATFEDINRALKNTPFGYDEEVFEFVCGPSEDDEMKQYYNLIVSGKDLTQKNLLGEMMNEQEIEVIRKLFDRIVEESDSSESEMAMARYLDYRNYMHYDIKTTDKNGNFSYYSKINKGMSGGEGQTPFYVVIAACFDRLMRRGGEKSACTVIFDEAFNNMDESRINALMNFYKKLGIQLAIVVPSNRMSALAGYMDEVIGIVKINNTVHVSYLG